MLNEVLNNVVVVFSELDNLLLEHLELYGLLVQQLQVLARPLEVELHVMLREIVSLGRNMVAFGKETDQIAPDDEGMPELLVMEVLLSFDQLMRTAMDFFVVVAELRVHYF